MTEHGMNADDSNGLSNQQSQCSKAKICYEDRSSVVATQCNPQGVVDHTLFHLHQYLLLVTIKLLLR